MEGAWLVIETGALAGRRLDVRDELVIGREKADLLLDDPEVSRQHACLRLSSGGLLIEDLGSRNGTRVNDRPIGEARRLADGDVILIGETRMVVVLERPQATVSAADGRPVVAEPARQPFATARAPARRSPATRCLSRSC